MYKNQAVFVAISLELVVLIVGSVYLGQYLDNKFGSSGLAMTGLCLLSLFVWIFHLVRLMKRYQDTEDSK